jgi:ABC-type nitrate/sulfonate/bicarbonate transport system substrate-binding protein
MLKPFLRSLIFIFVLMLLAACGTQQVDTVNVQLSWLDNIEFSAFYVAEAKGYYRDRNLTVNLIDVFDEEGNYRSAVEQVTSGAADFAITNSGDVLIARAAGQPVVAIMAIYQRHPLVFTSLAEDNIVRPQDFVGKTIHVSPTSEAMYHTLLSSQNIDLADVTTVDRTDFTIESLLNGDADIIDGWVITEGAELAAAGVEVNYVSPFEYGIEMYADVIITTEDKVQNQPELVQRFVSATLQGLNQAVTNPAEAATETLKWTSDIPEDVVRESANLQVPLVSFPGTRPGMMTAEVWEITHEVIVEEGLIDEAANLTEAYILTFVNEYYE